MSNWVVFKLDVLAGNPAEINQIEAALQDPCDKLIRCAADRTDEPWDEIAATVKKLVSFKPDRNLGYVDPSVNKARRFKNSFKDRCWGIVMGHIGLVSKQFPTAIFLIHYHHEYAGKMVIRTGKEVKHICDDNQQGQNDEWVLPNIFAPYLAEYDRELEFGSLWKQWVSELGASVQQL
jgi:hypothetical protein